jgi:hypothetical protein
MRKVVYDFHYGEWTVPAGKLVAVSPAISNRMPDCFPDPDRYDLARYDEGREEDARLFAWIPFGAGRHRCVGAAFAMMQLKAIFSTLLREYEFQLAQPPESYRNDHSKMVVQLAKPCCARATGGARARAHEHASSSRHRPVSGPRGVPRGEAPAVFDVDPVTAGRGHEQAARRVDAGRRKARREIRPTRALRLEEGEKRPCPRSPSRAREMIRRFVAENNRAGSTGDWSAMSQFTPRDALYTWNVGLNWEFRRAVAGDRRDRVRGRDARARDRGLPYVRTLVDDRKGEVIGVWRQIAPETDRDGKPYETRAPAAVVPVRR